MLYVVLVVRQEVLASFGCVVGLLVRCLSSLLFFAALCASLPASPSSLCCAALFPFPL